MPSKNSFNAKIYMLCLITIIKTHSTRFVIELIVNIYAELIR